MKAIILAGGSGKRLRPLTDNLPKALVPIADKPILQWQIEWFKQHGVFSFLLSVGYLAGLIRSHFKDGSPLGVEIDYLVEEQPLGTGGALRAALQSLSTEEPVYVSNGDVVTNLDPQSLEVHRSQDGVVASMALVALPSPYGIVQVDDSTSSGHGFIKSFREKPHLQDYWINAGVYAVDPNILDYLPRMGSLERDVFPVLSQQGLLYACKYPKCLWRSIDSHKDIEETSGMLEQIVTESKPLTS